MMMHRSWLEERQWFGQRTELLLTCKKILTEQINLRHQYNTASWIAQMPWVDGIHKIATSTRKTSVWWLSMKVCVKEYHLICLKRTVMSESNNEHWNWIFVWFVKQYN